MDEKVYLLMCMSDVHFIFKIKRYKNPSILMTLFMGWFFGDSAVAPPSWPESESEKLLSCV